jgi:hypothetical protein
VPGFAFGGASSFSDQPASQQCLLPAPDASCPPGFDPLSLIYFFESKDQGLNLEVGSERIQGLQAERNQALTQERQAIENEDGAAKSHGFWSDLGNVLGDVAKVAGVVASIAAAVCTAGAAAPIAALAVAGVLLSSASFVDGEFHVLQKLGVDQKTAAWLGTGMTVAGALGSFGAGVAAGAQAASSAASIVARTASVTSGAASMAQGASTIETGLTQAAYDQSTADEAQAEAQSAHALRFMQAVIDEAETSDDASKEIMTTIVVTKGIQDTTAVDSATAVGG